MRLHLTTENQALGLRSLTPMFDRLGITVTPILAKAEVVFPLTDAAAVVVADHPRFMPRSSLEILLNKDRLGETGLPTIPTTVILESDQAPPNVLVKPRNSVEGGLVYQPLIEFPVTDLDITFAVNPVGDIQLIAALRNTHYDAKVPGEVRMAEENEYVGVVDQIQQACNRLQITGGMHNLQFLWYNDQWALIDWNPRIPATWSVGLVSIHPYLDRPMCFMLGLPLPEPVPAFFMNKSYRLNPIPWSKSDQIKSLGLIPRRSSNENEINRVCGVGPDEATVLAKFAALESIL